MKTCSSALFLLFLTFTTFSQEKPDSLVPPNILRASPITFQTNVEGARVFLDGDSVGVTPVTVSIEPGLHHIKIVPPDVENWLSQPIVDSISVIAASPQTFHYSMTPDRLILSVPSGAEVLMGDSLIGMTPILVKSGLSSLKLRKHGYEEESLEGMTAQRGILSVHLKKIWQSNDEESSLNETVEKHSSLRLYLAGAATVLAGATTAYFKVKADNAYGEYSRTGEQAALSQTNRFDTAAGISLAATQLSLGLFAYFILSE